VTTTAAGAINVHKTGSIGPINDGLSYSVPLMLILLCHELGHYVVARLHGVDASLPYFIPFPPWFGLGTMGAVIGMRRVTKDRKKLIDIGAAGPLAGLCVAIPVILYGLSLAGRAAARPWASSRLRRCCTRGSSTCRRAPGCPTATATSSAPHGLGRLGEALGHDDQPPAHRPAGRKATSATTYFGNRYNASRGACGFMPLVAVGVFVWIHRLARFEMGVHWRSTSGVMLARNAALPKLVWFALVGCVRRLEAARTTRPSSRSRCRAAARRCSG
jgi:hypothetical protein